MGYDEIANLIASLNDRNDRQFPIIIRISFLSIILKAKA
jgi:hypothetical protein